ncbi:MAG: hypothetical protein IJ901_00715 [Bacteroidaceae bacterium]|nr:hypothetical protein [Bacteroidaceae bacterium]
MRKKITFLKTFLIAAGLCMGNSAWAGNVYTILYGAPIYDTDETTIIGVTPQTDFTSADGTTASNITHTDANGANCDAAMPIGGSVLYSGTSFSKSFETVATKGIVHFEANYTATTNGQETWKVVDSKGVEIFGTTDCGFSNGNATKIWGFCNGVSLGTNWFRQARGGHNRVVLDINLTTKKVAYTVLVSSGNNSYSTLTGTYDLPNGVVDVKGLTATHGGYDSYMDNVSFYNVYDNAVTEYAYTINYQLNNTTIAEVAGAGEAGSKVNAETSIWNAGKTKKYYATGNTEFTIAAGTNTFNVAVREAETWTYTVNAVDASNNVLKALSTNSVVEGETANYGYPQYIAIDGTLYTSAKQSGNPWWGKSFTPAQNNEIQTVSYNLVENVANIVFCEEAENITGLTVISGGNTDIRASNRQGAYAEADVVVTTLPAGKYIVSGATYGNEGTTFKIKAGEAIVLTITTSGNPVHTAGEEFTLTEATNIVIAQAGNGGNSPKVLDYLYIQKTADILVSTTELAGYKTFYNATKSFEVDENTTIYKAAQVSGNEVAITAVDGKIIPAGQAVILKTAATDYAITLTETTAASADDFSDNALQAAASAGVLSGAYILAYTDADGLGFYEFIGSLDAGDVYVTAAAGAAKLRISVEGEMATAIQAIATEDVKSNVIYNLNGQRVVKPLKGIYIQNGKKILVK